MLEIPKLIIATTIRYILSVMILDRLIAMNCSGTSFTVDIRLKLFKILLDKLIGKCL